MTNSSLEKFVIDRDFFLTRQRVESAALHLPLIYSSLLQLFPTKQNLVVEVTALLLVIIHLGIFVERSAERKFGNFINVRGLCFVRKLQQELFRWKTKMNCFPKLFMKVCSQRFTNILVLCLKFNIRQLCYSHYEYSLSYRNYFN